MDEKAISVIKKLTDLFDMTEKEMDWLANENEQLHERIESYEETIRKLTKEIQGMAGLQIIHTFKPDDPQPSVTTCSPDNGSYVLGSLNYDRKKQFYRDMNRIMKVK